MCNFFAAIGMRDGSLRWHPMLDSHSDLLCYFEIDDSQDYQSRFVKLELKPGEDWLNPEKWQFVVDEPTAPVWLDDVIKAEFRKSMESVVRGMIIPQGMTKKIADGCLILSPTSGIDRLAGGRIMYASRADLTRANLSRANLTGADLTRAYLSGADLTRAYLNGADLTGAYLSGADLTGADLAGAYLAGAKGQPSSGMPAGWVLGEHGIWETTK